MELWVEQEQAPPGWSAVESQSRPGTSSYKNTRWGFRLPSVVAVQNVEENLRKHSRVVLHETCEAGRRSKWALQLVNPTPPEDPVRMWENCKWIRVPADR